MSISTVIAKKVYTTSSGVTEYPFPYRFFETTDLVVKKYTIADGTLETLDEGEANDYTVQGSDDGEGGYTDYTSGGTIILNTAIGDGYKLIITRTLPLNPSYDLIQSGVLSESSFTEAIDRLVAISQQLNSEIARCVKMDESYTSVTDVFDVEDLDVSVDSFVVNELTAKTTIAAGDYVPIADSEDSNVNKKILASSIININGLTEDTSLHANDVFLFEDSQASYIKKKVKRDNLINMQSLTEKTTPAAADLIIIEDSAASYVKKKIQYSSIKPAGLTIASQAAGDILYFDGTNWKRLAKGTALQLLRTNSGATAPEWGTVSPCQLNQDETEYSDSPTGGAGVYSDLEPYSWQFCFWKTPNVNTMYIEWQGHASNVGGQTDYQKVSIDGGSIYGVQKTMTDAYQAFSDTIDISSLTDGQFYTWTMGIMSAYTAHTSYIKEVRAVFY